MHLNNKEKNGNEGYYMGVGNKTELLGLIRDDITDMSISQTRDTCDPLNRRAVRVSMGSVFLVPWTWLDVPISSLHEYGFRTVAMALTDQSIPLDDARLKAEPRLAIIMGTEGDGLPQQTIHEADYTVRIPMAHGVDSLNVAAAAAVAFWELCK